MNQNIVTFILITSLTMPHTNTFLHCSESAEMSKIKYLLVINSTSFPILYICKPITYLLQMGGSLIVEATNSPH